MPAHISFTEQNEIVFDFIISVNSPNVHDFNKPNQSKEDKKIVIFSQHY